jgi:hypothetical protein
LESFLRFLDVANEIFRRSSLKGSEFMSKDATTQSSPTFTVGDLITELCRWPDHAAITFRCSSTGGGFQLSQVRELSRHLIEVELASVSDSPPVVPAASERAHRRAKAI